MSYEDFWGCIMGEMFVGDNLWFEVVGFLVRWVYECGDGVVILMFWVDDYNIMWG